MATFPVFIKLRRSLWCLFLLVFIHGTAAGCVALIPIVWWGYALAWLTIVTSLAYSLRTPEIAALVLSVNEGLSCLKTDGSRIHATVLPDSRVFVWLVTLRFQLDGEKRIRTLTLLPDQMSGEEFRSLRLWLRWSIKGEREPNSV